MAGSRARLRQQSRCSGRVSWKPCRGRIANWPSVVGASAHYGLDALHTATAVKLSGGRCPLCLKQDLKKCEINEYADTIIVGGGQARLALSYYLNEQGRSRNKESLNMHYRRSIWLDLWFHLRAACALLCLPLYEIAKLVRPV